MAKRDDTTFAIGEEHVDTIRRVATLQRSSMNKLEHLGIRIGHLLSVMNVSMGSLCSLRSVEAQAQRRSDDPADRWKTSTPSGKYDGGADAALDTAISAAAMRLAKLVEDDESWSATGSDELERNLNSWSAYEAVSSYQRANAAIAQRRPCVLHNPDLIQGPEGLWYAVLHPLMTKGDEFPVVGVGETPRKAMDDFDRAFGTGELNPAALLWLRDAQADSESKPRAKSGGKSSNKKGRK